VKVHYDGAIEQLIGIGYDMTSNFNLGRTNYQRLRDLIRNDIITGQFEVGARLKISDLANRYGLSAMPIREALQQLQGEGLVVLSANKGASVRRIDERFLWQMYEVRKALETFFAAELASRVTDADVSRMHAMLDEQQSAIAAADEERLQKLDRDFHGYIVGATMNEEAASILNRSYDLTRPLRLRFGRGAEQRARIPRDHLAIVEAIAAGDGPAAGRLISDHINSAFADLAKAMRLGKN
jgi:DNA-binding GntR family transcriptional regulator